MVKKITCLSKDQQARLPEFRDKWLSIGLSCEPCDAERAKIASRSQLADGSTQGSRHCIDSFDGVTMFERSPKTEFDGPILLIEQERTIEHPEHGNVTLPPGCYAVTYQRDLDEQERAKRVAD